MWPAATRGAVGDHELQQGDLPLPESWPHHAFVTSDVSDADRILAAFAREGWRADKVENGPPNLSFSLVRGWIENETVIEIGGTDMRQQYENFFRVITGA